MELGIITDEVHPDFAVACRHVADWGLELVEVRNVDGKNVVLLDDAEAERAAETVRALGLKVSAVASPVFKSPFDERAEGSPIEFSVPEAATVAAQLGLLERACRLANFFGTGLVRVFTFLRVPWSGEVVDEVVRRLAAAAEVAAGHGVTLAVENEHACVVGSGRELGELFRRLDAVLGPRLREHVGALWDPGNALATGERPPFPDGYGHLPAHRVVHVHLKDLREDERAAFGTFVPLGRGSIDYVAQFRALRRDGYRGALVLEPHYQPSGVDGPTAAKECVDALRAVLAAAEA